VGFAQHRDRLHCSLAPVLFHLTLLVIELFCRVVFSLVVPCCPCSVSVQCVSANDRCLGVTIGRLSPVESELLVLRSVSSSLIGSMLM
jgi:hypothetical protein